MSDDRSKLSNQFEKLVSATFSFLATEFNFHQFDIRESFGSAPFGGEVSIFFGNDSFGTGLDVFLDFETFDLDIAIVDSPSGMPVEYSVWGQTHIRPAALLSVYCQYKTGIDMIEEHFPESCSKLSNKENMRRRQVRQMAIQTSLEEVLARKRRSLAEIAMPAVLGDVSEFGPIQALYREKNNAYLSPDQMEVLFRL